MRPTRGRARLGILVPFTNTNLEPDIALMCPQGVSLHVARMGGYDENEIPDESQMQGLGLADLDGPLRLLMGAKPDVVLYGCTSATLTHGPEFDASLSRKIRTHSGAATVTAAGALVRALNALQARRIGFVSPYVPAINDLAVRFLKECGIDVVARSEVTSALDNEGQGALTPEAVFDLGLRAQHEEADALVLSCTDMRSLEVLDRLEATTGLPVISSNQAMMFAALQELQINDTFAGLGSLLRRDVHDNLTAGGVQ